MWFICICQTSKFFTKLKKCNLIWKILRFNEIVDRHLHLLLLFTLFNIFFHLKCYDVLTRLNRGRRRRGESRKSARTSITRSKTDRDSSSCDATWERITLSAWRRDSLLRDAMLAFAGELRATTAPRASLVFRDCEIGLRIFHSPALSQVANPEASLVIRNEMFARETDVRGGDPDLAWRRTGKMAAWLKTREWSWNVGDFEKRQRLFAIFGPIIFINLVLNYFVEL